MTTLFISDLHLDVSRPHLTQLFTSFLNQYEGKIDALYILGDLFEVWLGDDDKTEFNLNIMALLRQFAAKAPLYFMHGNRDFLIGKKFSALSGCQLLKEPTRINLYGESALLVHGDGLCTDDKKHQAFRKKSRSFIFKFLALRKPLAERKKLANHIRQKSHEHMKDAPDYLMDVNTKAYQQLMQKHKTPLLIHGHTHRPAIQHFHLHDRLACRIVLGDWHHQGNVLICHPNGEKRLLWFNA